MNPHNGRPNFNSPPPAFGPRNHPNFNSPPPAFGPRNHPNFNSPPAGFGHRNRFQSTPKLNRNNQFQGRSPNYNNQPNMHISPHNSSPYRQAFRESPNSFTSSNDSPENWNNRSNRSFNSGNSSSSYHGDVSHMSSFNSPRSNSGSFHQQKKNFRHQGKQNYQSPESTDSNPGHSSDINDYVHPSMLEDPWKHVMARIEKDIRE